MLSHHRQLKITEYTMKLRSFVLAWSALPLAGCASMLLPAAEPILPPLNYESYWVGPGSSEYGSGLRLKVYEDPNSPVVAVAAAYAVGAQDESPAELGLAHLCEHLAFDGRPRGKGTPNLWTYEVNTAPFLNANTTQDRTTYFEMGRPDLLPQFMQWEAWRLRDTLANLEKADFERERDVVANEYRQDMEDNPNGVVEEWLNDAIFPATHPYHDDVIGTKKSINALTMEQAQSWVKRFYTPDHLTLVVMGPVKGAQVEALVRGAFREATGMNEKGETVMHVKPAERKLPPIDELLKLANQEVRHHKAAIPRSRVMVFWLLPQGLYDKDSPVAEVSVEMLDSAVADGIYTDEARGTVHVKGLGRFHGCGIDSFFGAGIAICELDLDKDDDWKHDIELIKDQLVNVWKGDIAPAGAAGQLEDLGLLENVEQAAALNSTRDFLAFASVLESPSSGIGGLPATVSDYILKTGDHNYVQNWLNNSQKVTKQQVADFAAKWLTRERAMAIHITAESDDEFRAHLGKPTEPVIAELGTFKSRNPSAEVVIGATAEDLKAATPHPNLAAAKRVTLPNGLSVVVLKRGTFPVVRTNLVIRRDPGEVSTQEEVVAGLAMHSIIAHRKYLADVGAQQGISFGPDANVVSILSATGNLPHVLDYLAAWTGAEAVSRSVPKGRFDSVQAAFEYGEKDVPRSFDEQALRKYASLLFGDDVYGTVPSLKQIDDAEIGQVDDWIKKYLVPNRSTLIIVGNVDEDDAMANVEKFLGGWSGNAPAVTPGMPPAMPEKPRFAFINRPAATNALILVGARLPSPEVGRTAAARVYSAWLSESLNNRLREAFGVTYGYRAGIGVMNRAADLMCSGEVENKGAALAVKTVVDFLNAPPKVADDPVLARYKYQVADGLFFRTADVSGNSSLLTGIAAQGLPPTYFDDIAVAIPAVTAKDVQDVAKQLNTKALQIVVAGDGTVVLPALKKLGIEPTEVIQPPEIAPKKVAER
jgi:zinc protease